MNNIFTLLNDIMTDYKLYIDSFINIADDKIRERVNEELLSGSLYPEPLIQFNPTFESDGTVDDLVTTGVLNKELNKVFYDEQGKSWNIYKHQSEAIKLGNAGKGFVVTSGTGSGKSLTYISTIFNYLFENKNKTGIKAIIVYPLNALINSQEIALKNFNENYKKRTGSDLPFKFAKYTGQESQAERERINKEKTDILLTNYMMLELLMVRKNDEDLRNSFLDNLKFLVFDELHVYKGRQGADVSMLIRRIKAACKQNDIICIGTSATMASGSIEDQKETVAKVASNFFDTKYTNDQIVIESLTYSTINKKPDKEELITALNENGNDLKKDKLLSNPIAIWLERTIGVKEDGDSKVRNKPNTLNEIAKRLAEETGVPGDICAQKIIDILTKAESINIENAKNKNRETILPFKLHQFISQTGYVYITLQRPEDRFITLDPNPTVKLKDTNHEVPLFQTVFSRISGHEFICVRKSIDDPEGIKFIPRDFNENLNPRNDEDLKINDGNKTHKRKRLYDEYKDGYLIFDKNYELNVEEYIDILPASWVTKSGKIDPSREKSFPKAVYVTKDGFFSKSTNGGEKAWFLAAPLVYDPTCGVIYEEAKVSEKVKLISLGNEGRSTSTTLITLQALLALYKQGKIIKEQKLMSFTDNRQDASLQAGHFNDFIQVVHLRSAIEKVLRNESSGITIHDLIYKVQDSLNLAEEEYAQNPSGDPDFPNENNRKALRSYISYRIIQDLKRGWRYVLPNLEQTALLEISYEKIDAAGSNEKLWTDVLLLNNWTAEKRKDFIKQVLDYFRNSYAIDFEMLRYENRLRIQDELNNTLNKEKLWSLDKGEKLDAPNYLSLLGADKAAREVYIQSIGLRSRLGRFIKHEFRKAGLGQPNTTDYESFMSIVLTILTNKLHFLIRKEIKAQKGTKETYQLDLSKVLWKKGDEQNTASDRTSFIILKTDNEIKLKPHLYFQKLYKQDFSKLPKSYIAAEHSGQISNEDKIDREEKFNDAIKLSALYCSPTMELGIDISSLNIVHMRNVPPSPANYAQRSGRAGRSGQSALVFTYASKYSPHDKHYFTNPVKMVAGIVQEPRIDLTNEELIKSHINSSVLSFLSAEEFKPSLIELIDIQGKTYKLRNELKIKYQEVIDTRFDEIHKMILEIVKNIRLNDTNWYTTEWLETQIKTMPNKLENALLRWRKMYIDALRQMNEAHEIKTSPIIKDSDEKKNANRSYWLAENRKNLLENNLDKKKNTTLSEFYTFRYLASEGFMPGYNFTRLPIRVFLGSRDRNESLSRPRFIGIREFGPNNLIYHNGGKYKITRYTPNDVSLSLSKIKISKETNYAFMDEEGTGRNQDPITGVLFNSSNLEMYDNLFELEEAQSENTERISCMEEIRASEGYSVDMYLNSADNLEDASKIKLTIEGQELMKLFYVPAAKLIVLNKKWKRNTSEGFEIGEKSGLIKTKKQVENPKPDDLPKNILLYTYDTSDILYIQPVKALNLSEDGVVTMQYALEKAVESYYNIEPIEINARLMGSSESKNIMLFESAEGSIGVLKDISKNPATLKSIFKEAYEICGFDYDTKEDKYPDRPKATYDDLLSYYNQMDHTKINRHSVKEALELLIVANPDDTEGSTYEEKYETLKKGLHHKSPGELELLEYLFNNGYRLPDYTNYNMEKYFIQPDFVYEKDKALIFVDGGIHKKASVKAADDKKRKTLELAGFDVLAWDYTSESVEAFVQRRQDIFRKVR